MKTNKPVEEIELLRGGAVVSSLASAFGSGLRETRLTALLGYLIALEPKGFVSLLGFSGQPLSVALETRHALDRSDILVRTTDGVGIIEAKVGNHDPFDQALKYPAKWRTLITEHLPKSAERSRPNCRYFRWRDLLPLLRQLLKSSNLRVRVLSEDLQLYLKEHRMIPQPESVEVYAREINEEKTLALFLHGQMYGCTYEASSRLPEALYFAPHFGQEIAANHPGVHVGISYLARIEDIAVVETFDDLLKSVREIRGASWLNRNEQLIAPVRQWDWPKQHTFVFLGVPRLVFNPSIKKEKLQAGKGWLSKRVFSFDTLFQAWGC